MAQAEQAWPEALHGALSRAGVRVVAHVPDAGHKRLIELCDADPEMRVVKLTTEEEGMGLLAGAWLGGARGALLMQSSGVGNCVNALASLTLACRFPLLMLVTMRGEWGEANPWQAPMGQAVGPIFAQMGVRVARADRPEDAGDCAAAMAGFAFQASQATAVLIGQRLIGAKSFQD